MNLKGEKVLLRAIEKDDIEFLRTMINDEEMERNVVGWSMPISKYEQEKWYENQASNRNSIKLIAEAEGERIGLATIEDIDWKNRKAAHGIKLFGSNVKGKGYGTDIVKTIMKYVFEELQLNRLYGSILEYNKASMGLYKKCGWEEEGRYKQSVFKNNKYIDEIPVGILKSKYETIKDNI